MLRSHRLLSRSNFGLELHGFVRRRLDLEVFNGSPTPAIDNVPMTISIREQVLAIEDIDIDEARIADPGQRDVLSILDGQSIYGTIPRT